MKTMIKNSPAISVRRLIRNTGLLLLLLFISQASRAQPFRQEIDEFKRQDSISFPPKSAILFVGSSSFRLWKNLDSYFPGYTIVNRGFGGSSLPDAIRYADLIIFPYQPKQIVIYCGENDIASSDTVTAEMVLDRFKHLLMAIRLELPGVAVLYVSIKPSPSRWHLRERMMQANELIRKYLKKQPNSKFISVWESMLGPDGKPIESIFEHDRLHMKPEGYAIWKKLIEPLLVK